MLPTRPQNSRHSILGSHIDRSAKLIGGNPVKYPEGVAEISPGLARLRERLPGVKQQIQNNTFERSEASLASIFLGKCSKSPRKDFPPRNYRPALGHEQPAITIAIVEDQRDIGNWMNTARDGKFSGTGLRGLAWVLVLFFSGLAGQGQVFTNTTNLRGVGESSSAAGDFDGDGNMDLLVQGLDNISQNTTVWRNLNHATFADYADLSVCFAGVAYGAVAVGDFYNAGRIDAVVTGLGSSSDCRSNAAVSQLWHNSGTGTFTLITNAGLPGVQLGSVVVGDFDNDGRLDVVVWAASVYQVYRNMGNGTFTNFNSGISGPSNHSANPAQVFAADFDNDGYLDLLFGTTMWRNLGNGSFSNLNSGLPANALAIGDFDNDGYLDVLVLNGSAYQVWRNLGNGTFTNYGSVPLIDGTLAAAGDYDNDGYLDLFLGSYGPTARTTQVWRSLHNGTFTNVASVQGAVFGSLTLGDFNNDGLLDFLVTGENGTDQNFNPIYVAQVWQNISGCPSNAPPIAPTNLTAQVLGRGGIKLNWSAATDDHTPSTGLNYNIRVGSSSGGVDIVSPKPIPSPVGDLVVDIGNAQERLFSLLTNLSGGTYYWSVQAIDTAFAGGAFATEATFVIPPGIGGFHFRSNGQFQVAFNALARAAPSRAERKFGGVDQSGVAGRPNQRPGATHRYKYSGFSPALLPPQFAVAPRLLAKSRPSDFPHPRQSASICGQNPRQIPPRGYGKLAPGWCDSHAYPG